MYVHQVNGADISFSRRLDFPIDYAFQVPHCEFRPRVLGHLFTAVLVDSIAVSVHKGVVVAVY